MKIFKINKNMSVVCQSMKTRNGFKHKATLMVNNQETAITAECNYINRTWERYEFESVLEKLSEMFYTWDWLKPVKIRFKKKIKEQYN